MSCVRAKSLSLKPSFLRTAAAAAAMYCTELHFTSLYLVLYLQDKKTFFHFQFKVYLLKKKLHVCVAVRLVYSFCFPFAMTYVVFVVVVFTLKAVPVSTQYFLTSVLVQLTWTPSVVTG